MRFSSLVIEQGERSMLKVYGIKNCTSVKKALVFLEQNNQAYEFIDYKKTPPSKEKVICFLSAFDEQMINKKGATYRKLCDDEKMVITKVLEQVAVNDRVQQSELFDRFCDIIKNNTSVLKRPIVLGSEKWQHSNDKHIALIGFDESVWRDMLIK